MFQLPTENYKHPNFEWDGRGGGGMEGVWILLFSEVTLFEYNVSTILSPIVAPSSYKNRQTLATKQAWEQAMNKRERAACKESCVR